MQGQWFYGIATNRLGPVPAQELQRLAQSGQIGHQTLVWSEGMPQWMPAGAVPWLFPQRGGVTDANSAGLNLLLPIGPQSGWAIAAGYCGIIGLLVPFLALLAILFGFLGLAEIKKHPEKRGKGRAITGIVCGVLWIAAFLFIVVVAR